MKPLLTSTLLLVSLVLAACTGINTPEETVTSELITTQFIDGSLSASTKSTILIKQTGEFDASKYHYITIEYTVNIRYENIDPNWSDTIQTSIATQSPMHTRYESVVEDKREVSYRLYTNVLTQKNISCVIAIYETYRPVFSPPPTNRTLEITNLKIMGHKYTNILLPT